MTTIAEAIRQTTTRLLNVGIPLDEASIEARIIIRHIFGLTPEQLLVSSKDRFLDSNTSTLNDIITRRETREPLAYILGEREFYSRNFQVNRHVLIPRPETEHLIDLCTMFTQQNQISNPNICDIGTGSGIIAITLAKELNNAKITATDLSAAPLKLARANAKSHNAYIHFTIEDATQNTLDCDFDIIVSNPPYIKTRTLQNLQPEVRDWEPKQALDGGPDGMKILRPLIHSLPNLLHANAPTAAFIEIDPPVVESCLSTVRSALPNAETQIHRDYAGLERILVILRT